MTFQFYTVRYYPFWIPTVFIRMQEDREPGSATLYTTYPLEVKWEGFRRSLEIEWKL